MVFIDYDPVTNSQGVTTGKQRVYKYWNIGLALTILVIILIAGFYAHYTNPSWEAGSSELLTAFTGGMGLVIGAILAEDKGAG